MWQSPQSGKPTHKGFPKLQVYGDELSQMVGLGIGLKKTGLLIILYGASCIVAWVDAIWEFQVAMERRNFERASYQTKWAVVHNYVR